MRKILCWLGLHKWILYDDQKSVYDPDWQCKYCLTPQKEN